MRTGHPHGINTVRVPRMGSLGSAVLAGAAFLLLYLQPNQAEQRLLRWQLRRRAAVRRSHTLVELNKILINEHGNPPRPTFSTMPARMSSARSGARPCTRYIPPGNTTGTKFRTSRGILEQYLSCLTPVRKSDGWLESSAFRSWLGQPQSPSLLRRPSFQGTPGPPLAPPS